MHSYWGTYLLGVSQYIDTSVYRNTQRIYIVSQYEIRIAIYRGFFFLLIKLRVPTVLEKSLNFGFSLKSPWKWICPWKVLEFRGPSLKFQLVVLDFLFCVFWTESLNGYSKLRGTRANFSPKNSARFARSSLQVKYFSSSSCSYI